MEVSAQVSWSGGGTWKYLAGTEFYSNVANTEYSEGDTIEITNALPTDINQSDFITSLIKCFNLYMMPDPTDDKKLIIEPRDDFYLNTPIDWTQKHDDNSLTNICVLGKSSHVVLSSNVILIKISSTNGDDAIPMTFVSLNEKSVKKQRKYFFCNYGKHNEISQK